MNDDLRRPPAHLGARDARAEERSNLVLETPSIELPKGGGAIGSIGESFEVRALTGTASLTVPLAAPPGRQGFGPALSLAYDSGAGQGPFGMGWSLDAPSIMRRTDKRLPTYSNSDTFSFAGAELVPHSDDSVVVDGTTWQRTRYLRREEGAFDWIEHLRNPNESWWRVRDRNNVLRVFGRSSNARTADPKDARRVYRWHLEEIRDDRGNVAGFSYKHEDGLGLQTHPSEVHRHRHGGSTWTYLKRVCYGNRTPDLADPSTASDSEWCFELVFDYGEHDAGDYTGTDWANAHRLDPFSRYKCGFDLRCRRLCRQVLAFHRFAELGPDPVLVRSTAFTYDESPAVTTLQQIEHRGHQAGQTLAAPPLTLTYQQPRHDHSFHPIEGGPPDPARWQWVDLDGEGLPGLLSEQAGSWWYSANAGGGRLERPRRLRERPNLPLSSARLMDIDGDSRLELAVFSPHQKGTVRRSFDGWDGFRPFKTVPNIDVNAPEIRWIDLDGDGRPEILMTAERALTWWPSEGTQGFGNPRRTARVTDERDGPTLLFNEADQSVFLADMSGDGLTDLVRIRNGRITYWPNLGHGRFGAMIVLGDVPRFDTPDRFDPARIRLADVDGTGPADVLYLGPDGLRWWPNLSGNRLGAEVKVSVPVHDHADVQVSDIFGEGTAALVWTTRLGRKRALKALRLTADGKPWLLKSHSNGLGRTTTLSYTPSTSFYLADRRAGTPWVTRLPFVVHCLSQVEIHDAHTGWRFTARSTYHHGFYDGVEREFRGFGRVEQFDLEAVPVDDATHNEPPVRTVSWFHTGAWEREQALLARFADEAWDGPIPTVNSPIIPAGSPREHRDAHRALRGKLLRREVFADDGTALAGLPFVVEAHEHGVRRLQGETESSPAVFHCVPGRSLTVQVERNPQDPRVAWSVPLEVDAFGEVVLSAAIAEPRAVPAIPEQGERKILITERELLNVDGGEIRHLSVEAVTRTIELHNYAGAPTAAELTAVPGLESVQIGRSPGSFTIKPFGVGLRELTVVETRYFNDATNDVLPLRQIGARRLVYDRRTLAFANGLERGILAGTWTDANLRDAGHLDDSEGWWIHSGHATSFGPFFTPLQQADAFGNLTNVIWDADSLFPTSVTDALGNTVSAEIDRVHLTPIRVTDANGAVSEAVYDALGRVVASVRRGANGEGDTLAEPGVRISYETDRFVTSGLPNRVRVERREIHGDPASRWHDTWTYTDGGGEVLTEKVRAEDDNGTPRWVGNGRVVLDKKARPIKRYEPYFSDTAEFEAEEGFSGVTSLIHYDAVGRPVRVDLPDGTHERVAFDAWSETVWDASDTVLDSAWYAERLLLPANDPKRLAAEASALHANTPTSRVLDTLGRPVRVEAHAGFDNGSPVLHTSSVTLDIQGNALEVTDARGIVVQIDRVDRLGRVLESTSPDAGTVETLPTADEQVSHQWKTGDVTVVVAFDSLRRPYKRQVTEGGVRRNAEVTTYGENAPANTPGYLKGRIWKQLDDSGSMELAYDFKGNLISSSKQVLAPGVTADWNPTSPLTPEIYVTETDFDALDRAIAQRSPGAAGLNATAVQAWTYTRRGQLESISVAPRGGTPTARVSSITYDARGQRQVLTRSNGVVTTSTYDANTFRLIQHRTVRASGPGGTVLQDLSYVYDAVGNVSRKADAAQDTVYFANAMVTPEESYTYDPLHRLIEAKGRESVSGVTGPVDVPSFVGAMPATTAPSAMRRYTESYTYDEAGNLLELKHFAGNVGANPTWTRTFQVAADSNLLVSTTEGAAVSPVTTSNRGAVVALPHLSVMERDHRDLLVGLTAGTTTAEYRQDAGGQRVIRRVDKNGALEERLYCGDAEVYRKFDTQGVLVHERWSQWVSDGATRMLVLDAVGAVFDPNEQSVDEERWQLGDLLGSGVVEVDGAGLVICAEGYHPYGSTAWVSGRSQREVKSRRFRYTGKERDDESGLQAHGVRMYAPWLGRWMSADPIGLGDGLNRHLYVHANPVGGRDPSGTKEQEDSVPLVDVVDEGGELFGRSAAAASPNPNDVDYEVESRGFESDQPFIPTVTAYDERRNVVGNHIDIITGRMSPERYERIYGSDPTAYVNRLLFTARTVFDGSLANLTGSPLDEDPPTDVSYEAAELIGEGLLLGAPLRGVTPSVSKGGVRAASSTRGTWGGFAPTPRAAELAEQLVRPGAMVGIPRGSTNLADIASLASSEGAEFAVVRMGESRFLVRGTVNTTTIPEGSRLILHVHPGGGYMGLQPSAEDIAALGLLGQERSALLNESGVWRTFGPEGGGSYLYNYRGQ